MEINVQYDESLAYVVLTEDKEHINEMKEFWNKLGISEPWSILSELRQQVNCFVNLKDAQTYVTEMIQSLQAGEFFRAEILGYNLSGAVCYRDIYIGNDLIPASKRISSTTFGIQVQEEIEVPVSWQNDSALGVDLVITLRSFKNGEMKEVFSRGFLSKEKVIKWKNDDTAIINSESWRELECNAANKVIDSGANVGVHASRLRYQ